MQEEAKKELGAEDFVQCANALAILSNAFPHERYDLGRIGMDLAKEIQRRATPPEAKDEAES